VTKRFAERMAAVQDRNPRGEGHEVHGSSRSIGLRKVHRTPHARPVWRSHTDGEIRIGHGVVNEMPSRDCDVAMVFHSYALYPRMTVHDNMAFGIHVRGMAKTEVERRVEQAVPILELGSLLKRIPRQLSAAQSSCGARSDDRARAPGLPLDEPLSNLDAKLRVQTRIELQKQLRVLRATCIYVYVTQDQVEAMTTGDRIAVTSDGMLQQVAPPREICDNHATTSATPWLASKCSVGSHGDCWSRNGLRPARTPPVSVDGLNKLNNRHLRTRGGRPICWTGRGTTLAWTSPARAWRTDSAGQSCPSRSGGC
jgi:ABC-type nitrate/sulfonate/bicarbonate transport system ATPase subunit